MNAIKFTNLAGALEWLHPGEYNFVSPTLIITWYAGDWYRCYLGYDYLVRDEHGVRPITIGAYEASLESK